MKTEVFFHVKCGGEGSSSLKLWVSLQGMDILVRILKHGEMLAENISSVSRTPLVNLEEQGLVRNIDWKFAARYIGGEPAKATKAYILTVAGKLVAKAWSREE